MKIPRKSLHVAMMMAIFCCLLFPTAHTSFAQSSPPAPPIIWLDSYAFFETNWASELGYLPLRDTNLISVAAWGGNALQLDRTNLIPAYLQYRIEETNGNLNIDLAAGSLLAFVVPDWASSNATQHGHGPGSDAFLLAAGDWSSGSPEGFWAIYINAGGTNIYFAGISNSVVTNYLSAPISWATNSLHMIGLTYSTNSALYLDGELAATGGPVAFVPNTNTWTNGFYIGSDDTGYEQFRGIFLYVELDTTNAETYYGTNYFTANWASYTNGYYTWLDGGGGGDDGMVSGGSLNHNGSSGDCIFSNAVYLTGMSSSNVPGEGVTFTFTIEGGSLGAAYDLFSTTNLVAPSPSNSVWLWLGQGTNCGIYSVTNQPSVATYYVLGTPLLAPDGSGQTVAWERLIGASPLDGYGTPNAWYLAEDLDPQTPGIGSEDLNGSGLPNWEKYLYGANPEAPATFAVWVGDPNGTSGIP